MLYVERLSIFEQGDKVLKQVDKRAIFKYSNTPLKMESILYTEYMSTCKNEPISIQS